MLVGTMKLLFILGILPFFMGIGFVKKLQVQSGKIATAYVSGYISMFAIFQMVYTLALLFSNQIETVVWGFSVAFLLAIAGSVIYARKEIPKAFKNLYVFCTTKRSKGSIIAIALAGVCMLIPIVMSFVLQYADGDDSYYLALATAIEKSGMINGNLPYTGGTTTADLRHVWSGGVAFASSLSRLTGLHPAILAHFLYPPFLFVIMFMIYWLIAKILLKDKKQYIPLFMIIIVLMYVFGNVSIYTETTFMITRTWQGKSIFSNIIVPIMILCFLKMKEDGGRPFYWVKIALVGIASIFASTMGIFFAPVFMGLASLIITIANKKWKYLLGYICSMIPILGYAVLYVLG